MSEGGYLAVEPMDGTGGSAGRALRLQTEVPHLVSMGGDRLSTSVTLHPIPPGRVTLGSGQGVDIPVQGTAVLPLHCHIENNEGVVTIYPLSENISIDGVQILNPTRLSQGVMLTIGRSNYMRFNHPAEAKLMKSVSPTPRISMTPITFETDNSSINSTQNKLNKKPPTVPKKSPRDSLTDSGDDAPSSIMTKVSKFEYLAAQNLKKSISPKVFSSNLVTVNIPAKDVIGRTAPDLQNYTKNLPQNALNYSDLNHSNKQHPKIPDRPIFGRKSPNYANVAVSMNEPKNVNNRIMIFENSCTPKTHNFNFDYNELNNKSSSGNKNINLSKFPSPMYNRNPGPYYRSVTPSPVSNKCCKPDHRRSGSLGELSNGVSNLHELEMRKNEAEFKRNRAQQDRIKEQQIGKAEQARLEEIITMCAEYEKQVQCEKNKPVTPNRIKTNGSLPRDKRQFGPSSSSSYSTPPSSPLEFNFNPKDIKSFNGSHENVSFKTSTPRENCNTFYENVQTKSQENLNSEKSEKQSQYENMSFHSTPSSPYPQSPRTRIKTFLTSPKNCSPKDEQDMLGNKIAILEAERYLLQNYNRSGSSKEVEVKNCINLESLNPKFILPLDDRSCPTSPVIQNRRGLNNNESSCSHDLKSKDVDVILRSPDPDADDNSRIEQLRNIKREFLAAISRLKRKMADIEIQEDELHRELSLEKALISGELKSKALEVEKFDNKKTKLLKRAQKIESNMRDFKAKQLKDQEECKIKLEAAQEHMSEAEKKLSSTENTSENYEQVFEEFLQAQEQLDNERKAFEDLEFHHLEEEADWLASREELQREILDLSQKIDSVKVQIEDLEQQHLETSKSNSPEYRDIQEQKMRYLIELEEIRSKLKGIDNELLKFSGQESEQEVSSDSEESDKFKNDSVSRQIANKLLKPVDNMSCSVIVSQSKVAANYDNMTQSFNEKILYEKSILELGKKFPSQDDIDRISKITLDAPINIDEQQGSLGKKTIESLKEIKRNRHLHLCQQGSQVIEQERQRVQALKEKVQQEVRSQWEQNKQDFSTSGEAEELSNSCISNEENAEKNSSKPQQRTVQFQTKPVRDDSEGPDSPRPMSETSEMSVEGGTLNRKRKPVSDKQRPLTRYLPIRGSDLDLRQHIESAGHQVVLCPHVIITSTSCRGFLHKKGSKLNSWSKRWFVFDRIKHTFTYYSDKSEKKVRGGAYFQAIEEVYLDHLNSVRSPNPQLTFIVKTHERYYNLLAPSPEAMRIWVDVIFTGAEGYQEFNSGI